MVPFRLLVSGEDIRWLGKGEATNLGGTKGRAIKSFLQNKNQYLHLFFFAHILVITHISATRSFLSVRVLENLFGARRCNKGVSCCLYPAGGDGVISPWWAHSSTCYMTNATEQQKKNVVGIMHVSI